jgi:hypothetical protein
MTSLSCIFPIRMLWKSCNPKMPWVVSRGCFANLAIRTLTRAATSLWNPYVRVITVFPHIFFLWYITPTFSGNHQDNVPIRMNGLGEVRLEALMPHVVWLHCGALGSPEWRWPQAPEHDIDRTMMHGKIERSRKTTRHIHATKQSERHDPNHILEAQNLVNTRSVSSCFSLIRFLFITKLTMEIQSNHLSRLRACTNRVMLAFSYGYRIIFLFSWIRENEERECCPPLAKRWSFMKQKKSISSIIPYLFLLI